jgi:hypothetical protein
VVAINLGTNDCSKGIPDRTAFTDAYTQLVKQDGGPTASPDSKRSRMVVDRPAGPAAHPPGRLATPRPDAIGILDPPIVCTDPPCFSDSLEYASIPTSIARKKRDGCVTVRHL